MLLLLASVLLAVWAFTALLAVGLCLFARRSDEDIAQQGELAPVIHISSAA